MNPPEGSVRWSNGKWERFEKGTWWAIVNHVNAYQMLLERFRLGWEICQYEYGYYWQKREGYAYDVWTYEEQMTPEEQAIAGRYVGIKLC